MSYRFYLFATAGSTSVAIAHAWLEQQENAVVGGSQTRGHAPRWVDELCVLLISRHPDLRSAAVATDLPSAPYAVFADNDDGVEISLYVDFAAVTIPYRHTGEQAEHVLLRVFDQLRTIRDATGFVVYDPQLDAVVKPDGLRRVLRRYTGATRNMRHFAEGQGRVDAAR